MVLQVSLHGLYAPLPYLRDRLRVRGRTDQSAHRFALGDQAAADLPAEKSCGTRAKNHDISPIERLSAAHVPHGGIWSPSDKRE